MHTFAPFSVPILLSQNVLEEINRLCQLIRSPFDLSHMLLIGHAHPDPLVQLAAAHCGYTVARPSAYFSPSLLTTACSPFGMSPSSYCQTRLRTDLCTLYTETGVKVCTYPPSHTKPFTFTFPISLYLYFYVRSNN